LKTGGDFYVCCLLMQTFFAINY